MVAAPGTSEGRRRRSDAERSISAVVAAASQLLAHRPRASIQEVADAAGVHRATVHRHFPTREDLLVAVREHSLDELEALTNDPALARMEPVPALAQLTSRALALGDRMRVHRVAASFDDAGDARAGVLWPPVAAVIRRAQAAGTVRGDLSAERLALAWRGLVLAVLPQLATGLAVEDAVGFVLAMLATPAA